MYQSGSSQETEGTLSREQDYESGESCRHGRGAATAEATARALSGERGRGIDISLYPCPLSPAGDSYGSEPPGSQRASS